MLKRVLMMQRLQGMETEPISAEDPYASMEKDQLVSMIHFLVKREDERAQENQELKDMVKELRDTHRQDVKTQTNLLKSIDNLTNQVADLTTQNKTLQQKVNDLLSQISVGNKVRFGSKSQKGIKKNTSPAQDREKDKDDFDGTNGAVMSSTSQTDISSADADPEPAGQTQKSYENRGSISGIIIANTGTELLILTEKSILEDASQIHVTFLDNTTADAQLKKTDNSTGLAVLGLCLPYPRLTDEVSGEFEFVEVFHGDTFPLDKKSRAIQILDSSTIKIINIQLPVVVLPTAD